MYKKSLYHDFVINTIANNLTFFRYASRSYAVYHFTVFINVIIHKTHVFITKYLYFIKDIIVNCNNTFSKKSIESCFGILI